MSFQKFKIYVTAYIKIIIEWFDSIFHLLFGSIKLLRLPLPRVTIFGGSRLSKEDPYFDVAYKLAYKLSQNGVAIITGGGPGIMEAANCGAAEPAKKKKKIMSVAVGIKGIAGEKGVNTCAQDKVIFEYFTARKWLLMNYSSGFIVFPGGYGTLDELFQLLTLIETGKLKKVPVILFGKKFWTPLIEEVLKVIMEYKFITQEEFEIITITDSADEALSILMKQYEVKEEVKEKNKLLK